MPSRRRRRGRSSMPGLAARPEPLLQEKNKGLGDNNTRASVTRRHYPTNSRRRRGSASTQGMRGGCPSFALVLIAGLFLRWGAVDAQYDYVGEVAMDCGDCNCDGTSDDGTILVMDNPSSGARVSRERGSGSFIYILYNTRVKLFCKVSIGAFHCNTTYSVLLQLRHRPQIYVIWQRTGEQGLALTGVSRR